MLLILPLLTATHSAVTWNYSQFLYVITFAYVFASSEISFLLAVSGQILLVFKTQLSHHLLWLTLPDPFSCVLTPAELQGHSLNSFFFFFRMCVCVSSAGDWGSNC